MINEKLRDEDRENMRKQEIQEEGNFQKKEKKDLNILLKKLQIFFFSAGVNHIF